MVRTVFFSFLWVLVFPLSIWADGKGAEASGKVGPPSEAEETAKVTETGKSDADSGLPKQTEQPAESGKNEGKVTETEETAKVTEAGKSEAKTGSLKQTELPAKSGKKDSETGQPEKGLLLIDKKSERELLQSKGEEATSQKRDSLVAKEGAKLKVSDTNSVSKDKEIITKVGKGKKDSVVPIIRTLEAIAEKDGDYLFAGKILADGGSAVLAAGIELSSDMKFKKTTKLAFSLQDGESSYRVKTKKLGAGTRWFYRAYVRNSEESNVGSVKKLKTMALLEKEGWWKKGEDLGAGWRKSKWFGAFRKQAELNWVFHEKLGWAYVVSDQRDGLWLWQGENGWTWTQEGAWPCLWSNKSSNWLCFIGKIEGKPIFYDYESRKIRNLPKKVHKNEKFKVTVEKGDKIAEADKASDQTLVGSGTDTVKEIPKEKEGKNSNATDQVYTQKDALNEVTPLTSKTDGLPKTDSTKKASLVSGKFVEATSSATAKEVAEEITNSGSLSKNDSSQKKIEGIIEIDRLKEKSAKTDGSPNKSATSI